MHGDRPEGVLAAAMRRQRVARRRRRRRAVVLAVLVVGAVAAYQGVPVLERAAAAVGLQGGPTAAATDPDGAQVAAGPGFDPARDPGLDPELARRFARAQDAAAADGVDLTLTSGRRTAAEQQQLVDDALARYGSVREAHRWVLPPESSAHVQGLAIDVGPTAGALWLGEHGLEHGLCRAYENEVWHFEKLPDGADACPPMAADSSGGW
ncbi:D-alanyl-D-alanine carboxypeptidase family protein [Cellulomonas composti]|uniref:D-alanyl-D-alanine carboxypeptidase family protein n=1 Tax=Cellulomonas composti TaxID=266130 RepID=UPI001C997A95|nr:D-alanyl-D-alanine carboxypeptidase family protein [Cellulomonas composti]